MRLGTAKAAGLLKGAVAAAHVALLVLGLLGVLPFTVWTSAMVAYGLAGEMVKLAETNADGGWVRGGAVGKGRGRTEIGCRGQVELMGGGVLR